MGMQHSDWDDDPSGSPKTPTLLSKQWVQVMGNGDPVVLTGDKLDKMVRADHPCVNDEGQERIVCGTVAAVATEAKIAKTPPSAENEAVPEHQARNDGKAASLALQPSENGLH